MDDSREGLPPPAKMYLGRAATDITFMTTRISVDHETSIGTGFFYEHCPGARFLVTNKHVLEGGERVSFRIHRMAEQSDSEGRFVELRGERCEITVSVGSWRPHPDEGIDLAFLPLAEEIVGRLPPDIFWRSIHPDYVFNASVVARMQATHPVAMVGYPDGLWEPTYNLPILRFGSTAVHPNVRFQGRNRIVDIACFPGSSGSPVFVIDPPWFASLIYFLGVTYATRTYQDVALAEKLPVPVSAAGMANFQPMNIAYLVRSEEVIAFGNALTGVERTPRNV